MAILLLQLGAVLIGLSKVGFGGGVGAVATPVLATVFSPREALGLTLPLLLATDLMALVLYRGRWDGRRAAALLPGTLIGIALAAPILRVLPPAALARVIGALALVSVLAPLRWQKRARKDEVADSHPSAPSGTRPHPPAPLGTRPHPPAPLGTRPHPPAPSPNPGRGGVSDPQGDRSPLPGLGEGPGVRAEAASAAGEASLSLMGFLAGLVAGFTSTLAHLGGMLIALYLLPLRLSNATFVATASLVYCAMNTAKLVPYVGAGLITRATLIQDFWLLPSLAAGVGMGFLLNRRMSGESFGAVVRVIAVVTGIKLLVQGA